MAGLLDIGPLTDTVTVNGNAIAVRGLNAGDLLNLIGRFPEIRALLSGEETTAERLLQMGGKGIGAIIAAGCGHVGEDAYETQAGMLSLETQADFIAKMWAMTFPNGIGSFVKKIEALGGVLATEPKRIKLRAVKSPAASHG